MSATPDHLVVLGDCRDVLAAVPEASIHLVVTSPPYWSIKDYGVPGQIGHGQRAEDYLEAIGDVLAHAFRVLHPGCRAAINIADQYLRASEHGRYRVLPIPAELTVRGVRAGFDFMGSVIWRKISRTRTSGGGVLMGSVHFPRDGHVTYEHESILLFRKPGAWPKPSSAAALEASRIPLPERSRWFRGIWDDVRPVFKQAGKGAMFPEDLPARLIRMYSFAGDAVLDPFLGSGTTTRAAAAAGRRSLGVELARDCAPTIAEKTDGRALLADWGSADARARLREWIEGGPSAGGAGKAGAGGARTTAAAATAGASSRRSRCSSASAP